MLPGQFVNAKDKVRLPKNLCAVLLDLPFLPGSLSYSSEQFYSFLMLTAYFCLLVTNIFSGF